MKKSKHKNDRQEKRNSALDIPHALVVDAARGECLFLIVEFSRPGENYLRRVISKKMGDGRIQAATYHGPVGPDGLCTEKKDLMWMTATEDQFMKSLRVMDGIYRLRGFSMKIISLDGNSMDQAAEIFQKYGLGKVMDEKEALEYLRESMGGGGFVH